MLKRIKRAYHAFANPEIKLAPEPRFLNQDKRREPTQDEYWMLSHERVFQRKASQDFRATPGVAMDAKAATDSKVAMDSMEALSSKSGYLGFQNSLPTQLLAWYASQSFIGYQACDIISQHWLIDKACTMPCEDSIRNGYEITANDGVEEIAPDVLDGIKKADERMGINNELKEFARKNFIFGIRIAMFNVEYPTRDPKYYEKPFNIEGVVPGSYKGITQIDPYWITPILDLDAASNPASQYFYEPTWWMINGTRVHRSHLVIIRTNEVGDLLKPTYFYGGVPLTQKLYERVYAAERCANEAPLLLMTKRSGTIYTDTKMIAANQAAFEERQRIQNILRTNFSNRFLEKDLELYQQDDTALADVDTTLMSQYQIVSSIAEVPVTKLMGTTLKGFNATGEFEEASYHERLKTIQTHFFAPLLERHHMLLVKSEFPQVQGLSIKAVWKPLDSTTAKGKAETNKLKAETDVMLVAGGILDSDEPRKRLANDEESGYNGLISEEREIVDPLEEESAVNSEQEEGVGSAPAIAA